MRICTRMSDRHRTDQARQRKDKGKRRKKEKEKRDREHTQHEEREREGEGEGERETIVHTQITRDLGIEIKADIFFPRLYFHSKRSGGVHRSDGGSYFML